MRRDRGDPPEDFLDTLDITVDDELECQSSEDNEYYDAVIKKVQGKQYQVEYEDGSTEWVDVSKLRLYSSDWEVNDQVFAYFEDDGYWYSAIITNIDGDEITVRYDCDGKKEVLDESYLEELDIFEGDDIECLDPETEEYIEVIAKQVEDDRILVEDEDGVTRWVTFDKVRYYYDDEE